MKNKVGIFSFFAGAGFLDLGFEHARCFETLFVNEYHKPFLDIYINSRKNLGIQSPRFGYCNDDINCLLLTENILKLKLELEESKKNHPIVGYIGGPPCPDFSVGGKNRGKEGENGRLSGVYAELICKTKPDFFLFENVKGLWRTKKHRQFYESLKEKFISNGYLLTEKLINSIEYGVPQDRDRIILIGFHKNLLIKNNYPFNGTPYLQDFDWSYGTSYDRDNVFNLPWLKTAPFKENSVFPKPKGLPIELTVGHWFEKNDVDSHPNHNMYFQPRAGLKKFKIIDEGDDSKKSYKRLHRWRFSPTAAYGNNEVHLHPFKSRRISVAEALSIQSLPKGFIFPEGISLTNSFKAIGNGVPFLAAQGLSLAILNFLDSFIVNKIDWYGQINRPKHRVVYKPTFEEKQLSVFESKE